LNVPDTVGVPLIVMVFEANAAVTPAGNPVAVPIPVAPVVAWVISVNTVLIHNVGVVLAALAVLFGVTVIVPVAFTAPSTCQWNIVE
jgi:Zn-dependent membrane protease YugP